MRYINIDSLRASDGWLRKAHEAGESLLACSTAQERGEIFQRKRILWEEIKPLLEDLSAKKCWYCEVIQVRSDMAVDHFRPKASVVEAPDHEGYWWLAFDPENFRYSCTFCNSRRRDRETDVVGGKHDHFPLLNEMMRAKNPDDDYSAERPCLLDPADPEDPQLLWFYPNGEAAARYREGAPERYMRARTSIELYNLNHSLLTQRRAALAQRIRILVKRCETGLGRNPGENASARDLVKAAQKELLGLIDKNSELSAFAKAILRNFEDKAWVKELLHFA